MRGDEWREILMVFNIMKRTRHRVSTNSKIVAEQLNLDSSTVGLEFTRGLGNANKQVRGIDLPTITLGE